MNESVTAWLNSPESDEWRERTFTKLYALVSLKADDVAMDYVGFLWRA